MGVELAAIEWTSSTHVWSGTAHVQLKRSPVSIRRSVCLRRCSETIMIVCAALDAGYHHIKRDDSMLRKPLSRIIPDMMKLGHTTTERHRL